MASHEIEICGAGNPKHVGGRCVLRPGHDGEHECNGHTWPQEVHPLEETINLGRALASEIGPWFQPRCKVTRRPPYDTKIRQCTGIAGHEGEHTFAPPGVARVGEGIRLPETWHEAPDPETPTGAPCEARYRLDGHTITCGIRGPHDKHAGSSPLGGVITWTDRAWRDATTWERPVEGRKDDTGKARWDLLPLRAASAIVRVLTYGARKYAPENWRKVPDGRDRYFAAALRHLVAWRGGEAIDPESGEPHLAHAACCLFFLLEIEAPK